MRWASAPLHVEISKGGTVHRRSGILFVYAMLVMGISASILGLRKGGLTDGNVTGGLLALYFVGTALTTVRPSPWTRRIDAIALTFALGIALFAVVLGASAFGRQGLASGGVSHRTVGVMSFFVAAVLLAAASGDLRILRSGPLRGGPRLARPLWRMCFALFIAAGSFFSVASGWRRSFRPVHGRVDAGAADPAAICGDVLLVVESPPSQGVARARPIRSCACHHARKVISRLRRSSRLRQSPPDDE